MTLAREASVRKPKKNKSGGYILDEDIFSARRTPSKPLPQIPRSASTPLFSASTVFNLPTPPGGKPLPLNPRQLEDIEEEFELEDMLESMRFNPEELEFDSPRALNLSAKNPFSFLGNPEDVNWKSVYR